MPAQDLQNSSRDSEAVLRDYIKQAREKGMTDDQIRQELLGAGWGEGEIAESLKNSSADKKSLRLAIILAGLSLLVLTLSMVSALLLTSGDDIEVWVESLPDWIYAILLTLSSSFLLWFILAVLSIVNYLRIGIRAKDSSRVYRFGKGITKILTVIVILIALAIFGWIVLWSVIGLSGGMNFG